MDPLILVSTFLAAHEVPSVLLIGLVVVLVSLVAGRFFCGWICPFGTLHSLVGWVWDWFWRKSRRRERWSKWQRVKYYVLVAFLAMSVLRGHWVTIFDPLVLMYRSMATAVSPGLQWMVEEGSTMVYQADPNIGGFRLAILTEGWRKFLRGHVFVVDNQTFIGSGFILLVFVGVLLANGYRRRWWCRYVCPTGALLGVLSSRPFLRRVVREDQCVKCGICSAGCHGGVSEPAGGEWKAPECFVCLNCADVRGRSCVEFRWVWPWRGQPVVGSVGLSRRGMIVSVLGGVLGLWFLRSSPWSSLKRLGFQSRGLVFEPSLIRPPGARSEREFIERCTGCGLCMKVCPTGGLQPCIFEAGLEGIWTPRLVPQLGACAYECNLCGQVCPTEAIKPLKLHEKKKVRLGLAGFDTTKCIPHAYGRDCIVCEECCPVPGKAIYLVEQTVTTRNGEKKTVRVPHVNPDVCIGCGVCENVCPLRGAPGVRVTSTNESRHTSNQPILLQE
ncbi:MAG: 4Fe-4S binding protein [Verrucomicrobiae bacterium]|nr:4Fe-4S binding protein [Verrucomicrobiae bacterium]